MEIKSPKAPKDPNFQQNVYFTRIMIVFIMNNTRGSSSTIHLISSSLYTELCSKWMILIVMIFFSSFGEEEFMFFNTHSVVKLQQK